MPLLAYRIATATAWLLVGLCVAFWFTRILGAGAAFGTTQAATVGGSDATPAAPDTAQLIFGFGGVMSAVRSESPVAAPSNYTLLGVVRQGRGDSSRSVALIAANGGAAKPFRVGAAVADGLVLKSVAQRSAELAPSMQAPATQTLELPRPAP